MKTIAISEVEHLYLDQIADLIAYARNPQVDNDPEDISYALSLITANEEVNNAAISKTLTLRHPQTHGPFPIELGLERAVVQLSDVVAFLTGYGISLVIEAPEQSQPQAAPVVTGQARSDDPAPPNKIVHSTKTRRDSLTPVIEQAQRQCSDPQDTAAVWAALLVLAEMKTAPLIGATEDGLQYLKNGTAASLNRDALRKRLGR